MGPHQSCSPNLFRVESSRAKLSQVEQSLMLEKQSRVWFGGRSHSTSLPSNVSQSFTPLCSAVQYSTARCKIIQCNTVPKNTSVEHSSEEYSTAQCKTVQNSAKRAVFQSQLWKIFGLLEVYFHGILLLSGDLFTCDIKDEFFV